MPGNSRAYSEKNYAPPAAQIIKLTTDCTSMLYIVGKLKTCCVAKALPCVDCAWECTLSDSRARRETLMWRGVADTDENFPLIATENHW